MKNPYFSGTVQMPVVLWREELNEQIDEICTVEYEGSYGTRDTRWEPGEPAFLDVLAIIRADGTELAVSEKEMAEVERNLQKKLEEE